MQRLNENRLDSLVVRYAEWQCGQDDSSLDELIQEARRYGLEESLTEDIEEFDTIFCFFDQLPGPIEGFNIQDE